MIIGQTQITGNDKGSFVGDKSQYPVKRQVVGCRGQYPQGVRRQIRFTEFERILTVHDATRCNYFIAPNDRHFRIFHNGTKSHRRNTHGKNIVIGKVKLLGNSRAHLQGGISEKNPRTENRHIVIDIQHVDFAIKEHAAEGEFLVSGSSTNQQVNHGILSAHRGIPRLVDGGAQKARSTRRLAIMRSPQPSLRKAGARMVLSVHTSHRKDEGQLTHIG